jgi:hypothetical protein
MIFVLDKYPDPGDTSLYAAIKRVLFHEFVYKTVKYSQSR